MPLIFVLCTNKKTSTYKTIFQKMKTDQPTYCPKQINLDFELSAINAAKSVFPEANVQGCYFHLKQSVIRNLASNGLKVRYENDLQFAKEIRELISIAFLPEEKVSLRSVCVFYSSKFSLCLSIALYEMFVLL